MHTVEKVDAIHCMEENTGILHEAGNPGFQWEV